MRRYRIILMAIFVCFISITMPNDAETVENCDFESLKSVILRLNQTDGGEIDFACTGTIRFTEMLTISSDITISGADDVILDGYGLYTLFEVNKSLTLNRVIIQTAWTAIRNHGTLTITDSLFRDNQAYANGAAIMNWGTATITNSTFIGNETDEGGAIWSTGMLTLTDSRFVMNRAYSSGGAIHNIGYLTIVGGQFSQNRASDGSGGAIQNEGDLKIETSTFTDNQAYSGAVIINRGNLNIRMSVFNQNRAISGGGVIYGEGQLVILDSRFIDNHASWGGVMTALDDVTIRNSYFEGNYARRSGGVITKWAYRNAEGGFLLDISHNTFVGNRAERNGGVVEYDNTTQVTISNNTFADNHAQFGGAIYGADNASATILHNTFVNNEGIGAAFYINSPADIRYNLLSGTPQTQSQCSGLYGRKADATNLTDYRCGGAGRFDDLMLGEFDGYIFPLLAGSPAIDAYSQPCQINRDQVGIPRPRADACDIGAVEWLPEGDTVIIDAQSQTITNCTWDTLSEAVISLNWAGGDIRLDCLEDTVIVFDMPIVVYGQLTITSENAIRFDGNNQTQIMVVDVTGKLVLDGITFVNGSNQIGGAIRNDGDLQISQSHFSANQAQQGGAIWNKGNLTITSTYFDQNYAEMGGAIYNLGQITMTDSTLIGNYARKATEDKFKPLLKPPVQYAEEQVTFEEVGGAIFTDNQVVINTSRFEDNWATQAGGAIFVYIDGVTNITDSYFSLNEAREGGALYYVSSPDYVPLGEAEPQNYLLSQPHTKQIGYHYKPVVQYRNYHFVHNSQFEANSATDGGAIYNTTWRAFYIRGNIFTNNEASSSGGAIVNVGDVSILQNTFIENRADKGGAIRGGYGSNNTFVRNSAITAGGAVYGSAFSYSTFVDNIAPVGGAFSNASIQGSVIIGDAPQCEGRVNDEVVNFATTPCGNAIVIPRDYLLLGEFDGRVFPLLPGSPLIDAMESCSRYWYSENVLIDQLGTSRPQGEKCDVGAVEFVGENISTLENLVITECTFERLSRAITYVAILSDDIRLDCPEDTTILFTEMLLILNDTSITNIGAQVTFDGGGNTPFFDVKRGVSFTINGLNLKNGFTHTGMLGSAIANNGQLHILNAHFENNIQKTRNELSGVIVNYADGDMIIENTVFTGNSTRTSGAVIMSYGDVSIIDSVFQDNQASGSGGAIYNYGELYIQNTQFINNQATRSGGAIYSVGTMVVRDSQFTNNNANFGGAITINSIFDYRASISRTVFENNTAQNGGAIMVFERETKSRLLSVENSQFIANQAEVNGGAIYNLSGMDVVTTRNSTFSQNIADIGGAIYNVFAVNNNTFVQNRAISKGGAVFRGGAQYSTFVDNTAPVGGAMMEAFLYGGIVSGSDSQCHNSNTFGSDNPVNIADVACGNALVVDDLRLGEFDGVVVSPLPDSPAINRLSDCSAMFPNSRIIHDQLGTSRPQGSGCDLGAVEFVPASP